MRYALLTLVLLNAVVVLALYWPRDDSFESYLGFPIGAEQFDQHVEQQMTERGVPGVSIAQAREIMQRRSSFIVARCRWPRNTARCTMPSACRCGHRVTPKRRRGIWTKPNSRMQSSLIATLFVVSPENQPLLAWIVWPSACAVGVLIGGYAPLSYRTSP